MRAAILKAPGELAIGDAATPRPAEAEILVKVAIAGVCAGDLYLYQGKNPYALYPQICGHEMAGTVIESGPGVSGFRAGEPVVVEPFIGCGSCYSGSIGKPNCCPRLTILGVNRAGGYAEYVTAPVKNIHRVPSGLDLKAAALAEPIAIGVQACRRGQVAAGEMVLVLGCGPIGLAIIEIARVRGARVLAADLLPERLKAAEMLGAEVLAADSELASKVNAITSGQGAPVVIEATGSRQAMESTIELVAAGGRIVIVGLVTDGRAVSFPGLDLTRKEPTILGSRASVDCFPESLKLLSEGKIRFSRLATEFSLWDAPAVFAELQSSPTSLQKVLLVA
jgi:2-desacetyl-2-hydroxyethyl bacteriochlorophyllide A dehydrogenase